MLIPVCVRALRPGPARWGALSRNLGATPDLWPAARLIFSETGVWEKDYQAEIRRKVEQWWRPRIMEQWKEDSPQEVNYLEEVADIGLTRSGNDSLGVGVIHYEWE